jgi:hypothetical protein
MRRISPQWICSSFFNRVTLGKDKVAATAKICFFVRR